jgi:hypothetical protein
MRLFFRFSPVFAKDEISGKNYFNNVDLSSAEKLFFSGIMQIF